MVDIYVLDTWYVLERGRDKDGCGRTPGSACLTLPYLLQQVNRTHLPPSTELRIATDKSLTIDQQAAVSTNLFYCLWNQISCSGRSKGFAKDAPPRGPNSFNFMQFFGKIWQNRMLARPPEGVAPPTSGKSWICHYVERLVGHLVTVSVRKSMSYYDIEMTSFDSRDIYCYLADCFILL